MATLRQPNLLADEGYENKPEAEGVRPTMQEGESRRKCSTPVIKKNGRRKPSRDYYYEYHLFCPKCQTAYHIEDARRLVEQEPAIFSFERNQVKPDCLTQKQHAHYAGYADQMLRLYREGIGKTRHELHSAVRQIFANEPDCSPQRIDAFCKLLDEDGVPSLTRIARAHVQHYAAR